MPNFPKIPTVFGVLEVMNVFFSVLGCVSMSVCLLCHEKSGNPMKTVSLLVSIFVMF